MKTMCPPGYHHNGFVATHALGHMMYGLYILLIYLYVDIDIDRYIYQFPPLCFNSCSTAY